MSTTPNFANTPHNEAGVATAALTNLNTDTPGGTVPIYTATVATNITRITAQPRATVTAATAAYLYLSKNGGTTMRQKDSVTLGTQTINGSSAVVKATYSDYTEQTPLRLGAGESLYGGLGVLQAGGVVWNIETADF